LKIRDLSKTGMQKIVDGIGKIFGTGTCWAVVKRGWVAGTRRKRKKKRKKRKESQSTNFRAQGPKEIGPQVANYETKIK
jgi:hypothetical protein